MARKGARVLLTGFEPFPGAPVNPTEWLVATLRDTPPALPGIAAFRAEVLPVAYGTVAGRLSEIGRSFQPDIAVHFGLAQSCGGFRLERLARNWFAAISADNDGVKPTVGPICAGPEIFAPTLPLDVLHERLAAAGLPVEWSDDAGGYLCNTVFTLSAAGACEGFRPTVTGFVHVPLLGGGARLGPPAFTEAAFRAGVDVILSTAVEAFAQTKGPAESRAVLWAVRRISPGWR